MSKKWLKRFGCCAGIFLFIIVVLFGVMVFVEYRRQHTSSPEEQQEVSTETASSQKYPFKPQIVTEDDPSVGPKDAKVTIVEFSDFGCDFCQQAFPIAREIMYRYSDRVRFIFRDFPVAALHPDAQKAAEAGACAHSQGKFWAIHDKMFQSAGHLAVSDLKRYAREAGLDTSKFDACLDSGKFANEVQQDLSDGIALGARGTPTWFINGERVEGVIPRDSFIKALDQLLAALQP